MQNKFKGTHNDHTMVRVSSFIKRKNLFPIITALIMLGFVFANADDLDMDKNNAIIFRPNSIIRSSELNSKFAYLYHQLTTGGVDMAGIIVPYGGSPDNIPANWHLCDGQQLQVTNSNQLLCERLYPAADCAIGDWFATPDLRGVVIAGVGQRDSGPTLTSLHNKGSVIGNEKTMLKVDQLPPHEHKYYDKVRLTKSDYFKIGNYYDDPLLNTVLNDGDYGDVSGPLFTEQDIWQTDDKDTPGDNTDDEHVPAGTQQPVNIVQPTIGLYFIIHE